MPSSGGSVSDAPVNKVVDGKSHYLAYITPDEGKSLKDQGGQEVITDSGIPAYPPPTGTEAEARAYSGGSTSGSGPAGGASAGGDYGGNVNPSQTYAGHTAQEQRDYRADPEGYVKKHAGDTTETKESLITKLKEGLVDNKYVNNIISKMGWVTDNTFMNAIGGAFGIAMGIGGKAQSKAITWDLNRRLQKEYKIEDDPRYRKGKSDIIQDRIRRANLPSNHPDHYGQDDYSRDYPSRNVGGEFADDRDDNARGLTNIITPYAAHAIGGTTPVNSMAAQWYAGLGSGPSNPGAFNLTQEYASAKAKVSQRLGNPTSVGQMAVSNSPFFNFLKDNSLNKGIL